MKHWKKDQVLYFRSYLLTLGVFFLTFSQWFAFKSYQRNELFNIGPLLFLSIGGIVTYLGVCGSEKKVGGWASSASKHWASVVIFALAYPVYLVWKAHQNK